jgi:hypothetical protein
MPSYFRVIDGFDVLDELEKLPVNNKNFSSFAYGYPKIITCLTNYLLFNRSIKRIIDL